MNRLNLLTARPAWITGLLIIFTFLLTACAPAAAASQPSQEYATTPEAKVTIPATAATPEGLPATGATVQAADNQKFGKILVNASGMTLYTFEIDTPEASKCTSSDCVAFWPPYTISTSPAAGSDVTGALATITRPDGAKQVTYDSKPLYTFAPDKNPGDATGDGINEFGGIWHVVTLSGSSSDSTSSGGSHY